MMERDTCFKNIGETSDVECEQERHARRNRSGAPSKNGKARAALTWGSGKRPLKVHLWSGGQSKLSLCLYARAGVDPNLEIKGGELKVSAKGKLEKVKGNPIAKTAVKLSGISEQVLQWHHDTSAPTKMKVAGSTLPFKWAHVSLNRDYMMVGISFGGGARRVSEAESQFPYGREVITALLHR